MKLTNTLFTVAVAALSLTACGTKIRMPIWK